MMTVFSDAATHATAVLVWRKQVGCILLNSLYGVKLELMAVAHGFKVRD
jgi:uncharacterized membrane protein